MMAAFHSPKPFPYGGMCQKRAAYRKSVLPMRVGNARGSAHETAFALQLHKQSGHAPDCLYFEREKVPIWELFLVRVWQSPNTGCWKTEFFDSLIDGDIPSSSSDSESDIPVLLLTRTCEPDDTYRHQNI